MSEDPETAELKRVQTKREAVERESAREAPDEDEAAAHERRAEKANYLRQKLDERAESERER